MANKANKFQVVHGISELIAKTADPWKGLNKVTRLIAECVDGEYCTLFAYNRKTNMVTLVAAYGDYAEQVRKFSFSIDNGLTGRAIRTGNVINVDDQSDFAENLELPGKSGTVVHGLLIVPLVIGGMTIGALVLARNARRKYSQKTLETVQEIATPLAMFILNTMLVKQQAEGEDAFAIQQSVPQASDKPLCGTAVVGGVVCGNALLVSGLDELLSTKRKLTPANKTQEAILAEKNLYQAASEAASKMCMHTAKSLANDLTEADCDIFTMHAMLLEDPTIKKTIGKFLDEGYDLTAALTLALRVFIAQYMKIEDDYLRERLGDVKDVLLNIKNAADNIRHGTRGGAMGNNTVFAKHIIVVAKELLPSQLVSLPLNNITGIICEDGGTTSHVTILARAMQKTMMVGVRGITDLVQAGDSILLDSNGARCYVKPSLFTLRQFAEPLRMTREKNSAASRQEAASKECRTRDGVDICLAGNLALVSEVPSIAYYGLSEVGLYRTEFMYMIRGSFPSEEDQFNVLKRLVSTANVPVTIRILDAGGDKPLPYLNVWEKESNPTLGWRGLRYLLSNPQVLGPHLRAILRASAFGKVRILFPMVADLFDLLQVKEALKQAAAELDAMGVPYSKDYSLGIMIEIPSAVVALRTMLPHIDFVSIGTNDLVQFLFAVDRGNPSVRQWYRQCHPVVLRLIRDICRTVAEYPGKSVSLCGELAGIKHAVPLLIGTGLRKISVTPSRATVIRQLISGYDSRECEKLLQEVLDTCSTEMDVMACLRSHNLLA